MVPGALHVNLYSRWIQQGLLLASGPSSSLHWYGLVYQVKKLVSHVYSFGKLGEVNHIVSQSAILGTILSPCVKS